MSNIKKINLTKMDIRTLSEENYMRVNMIYAVLNFRSGALLGLMLDLGLLKIILGGVFCYF